MRVFLFLVVVLPIRGDGGFKRESSSFHESNIDASSQSSSRQSAGNGPQLPVISSSRSEMSVSQKCTNGKCMTCVDGKCFNSGDYTKVKTVSGCPICVCTKACNSLVMATDGCPICSCNDGQGIREPCDGNSDCPKNATRCRENACVYSNVAKDLPQTCSYAYECPASQDCQKGSCVASTSGKHLEGQVCSFDYDCPSKYACNGKSCWEGGKEHLAKRFCTFDYNCPSLYTCRQQTCYKGGKEHGEFPCVFDNECTSDFPQCIGMTCFK